MLTIKFDFKAISKKSISYITPLSGIGAMAVISILPHILHAPEEGQPFLRVDIGSHDNYETQNMASNCSYDNVTGDDLFVARMKNYKPGSVMAEHARAINDIRLHAPELLTEAGYFSAAHAERVDLVMIELESGMGENFRNPQHNGVYGYHQFDTNTFPTVMRDDRLKKIPGMSDYKIKLSDRANPYISTLASISYAAYNRNKFNHHLNKEIKKANLSIAQETSVRKKVKEQYNTRLTHYLGALGGAKFLVTYNTKPNTLARHVMGAKKANRNNVGNRTVRQEVDKVMDDIEKGGIRIIAKGYQTDGQLMEQGRVVANRCVLKF